MSTPDVSPHADYATAVEGLAGRALDALRGVGGATAVAGHVNRALEPKTALAAVRVLGPDVFAPGLLGGVPFGFADAGAVADAFRVFPAAPDATPETAWRDWASARLLARQDGEVLDVPEPPAFDMADPAGFWREWSVRMAQLSPLALPELDSPVHDGACRHLRALERGTCRAMLRRDHPTAARLARWLAFARGRGMRPGQDVATLLRHLKLYGGSGARTALDIAIAGRLLEQRASNEGSAS